MSQTCARALVEVTEYCGVSEASRLLPCPYNSQDLRRGMSGLWDHTRVMV
jgi:hypothetical protein